MPSTDRYRSPGRLSTLLLALALLLAPLLGLPAAPALAAPSCVTSGTTVTCTYTHTRTPEIWTVPAGVTSATFDLYGATGWGASGLGGRVTATLAVTPGDTYQIRVGGSGSSIGSGTGYNGGSLGGGGGASDVRGGAFDLADRLLVAGGGGGAGGQSRLASSPANPGGHGGYPSGGGGGGSQGGGGGTQTAGGAGGGNGGAGSLGQGGAAGTPLDSRGAAGGSGGGGYYGGGGGGGSSDSINGGGGGGGSSYATPAATSVSFETGVRRDDGLVIVSYSLPADTTAPVAAPTQSPAANASGWNNSAVTVSWNWADNAGGSGIDSANCTTASTSSGEGEQTLSATCNDLAGNQGSASYSVKIDTTPPTITAVAMNDPNASGWYNGDVKVGYLCSDNLSGVVGFDCPPPQTLTGEGSSISSTARTVTDRAGNTSAPSNIVTVQIDRTAPSVSVTGVSEGATYSAGSVPAAGCSTTDALSGVATQANLTRSGDSLGLVTVTCAGATDLAGNSAPAVSVSYRVAYSFVGFSAPVENPPMVNIANAGRTIPLKWRVVDAAGNPVTNLTSVNITSVAGGCSASAPVASVEEYATSNTGFMNQGNGYYQFNWQTNRSWSGCRTLRLDLGDGVLRTALFQFR